MNTDYPDKQFFNIGLCVACGSGRIKVLQTVRPRRKLQCKVCGHKWETIEIVAQPADTDRLLWAELLRQGHISVSEAIQIVHLCGQ